MYISLQIYLKAGQGLCFENEATDLSTIYFFPFFFFIYFFPKSIIHIHNIFFNNFFSFSFNVKTLVRQSSSDLL